MIRDRIKELRRVPARDLAADPRNFRRHPEAQARALAAVLDRIGYADALIAREDAEGRLVLIDGHLRAGATPDHEVPVLVLDVDEDEAAELLLTIDPLAAMAETDTEALRALLEHAEVGSDELRRHVEFMAGVGGSRKPSERPPAPHDPRQGDLGAVLAGDAEWTILEGDVRDRLRDLPDGCVQTVVTSPPYWGLRDYGTAQWEGGDPDCQHRGSIERTAPSGSDKQASNAGANEVRAGDCACGARRIDPQIGLEASMDAWVAELVGVFREVRRVLRDDGTVWLNLGDAYASGGSREAEARDRPDVTVTSWGKRDATSHPRTAVDGIKPKDLLGQPWAVAFALRADGWFLRSEIIWAKPNPMPESITDRPTKAHETIFMLSKRPRYFFDAEAVREESVGEWDSKDTFGKPRRKAEGLDETARQMQRTQFADETAHNNGTQVGRNIRDVWTIATQGFPDAHFATFPTALVEPCIAAGSSDGGCCATCGAPYGREVQIAGGTRGSGAWGDVNADDPHVHQKGSNAKGANYARTYRRDDLGTRPSCSCEADRRGCIVLDPFNGSGTTGMVALAGGRRYIGVELNPEYASMARERIARAGAQE